MLSLYFCAAIVLHGDGEECKVQSPPMLPMNPQADKGLPPLISLAEPALSCREDNRFANSADGIGCQIIICVKYLG